MTLDEYLQQQETYAQFAATMIRIIEASLRLRPDVARPLTSQSRAKDTASLQAKLSERGLLASDTIEAEIKDLAGGRLVFYTNSDADRFLLHLLFSDSLARDPGIWAPQRQLQRDVSHTTVLLRESRRRWDKRRGVEAAGAAWLRPVQHAPPLA